MKLPIISLYFSWIFFTRFLNSEIFTVTARPYMIGLDFAKDEYFFFSLDIRSVIECCVSVSIETVLQVVKVLHRT